MRFTKNRHIPGEHFKNPTNLPQPNKEQLSVADLAEIPRLVFDPRAVTETFTEIEIPISPAGKTDCNS